jgi:predicted porin
MNRKLLSAAVSGLLAVPMGAQAVKYKLSGQVNRAVVYNDDGIGSDVQFVDNNISGTRWRLQGSEEIGDGMMTGFNWEWQNSSNRSTSAGIKSPGTGDIQEMRKAEVWFSGAWGRLSVGQGDGAGNGATEVDLSDTWNVTYSGRASFSNAVAWRTGAGGTISGVDSITGTPIVSLRHSDTFNQFDAFGRYDRVRYDTPSLGPVSVGASVGQDDRWEVAGRINSGVAGGQLSGGVFYGETAGVKGRWGGSASYLFSQGTNITVSGASNEPPGLSAVESGNWYVKLGHKWGNNSLSVAYGEASDVAVGFTDRGLQVGFNHNLPKAKVDLYAGYQLSTLDVPAGTTGVEDITAVIVGTKLKFD